MSVDVYWQIQTVSRLYGHEGRVAKTRSKIACPVSILLRQIYGFSLVLKGNTHCMTRSSCLLLSKPSSGWSSKLASSLPSRSASLGSNLSLLERAKESLSDQ